MPLIAEDKTESLDNYIKSFARGESVKMSDSWLSPDKGYHIIGSMISTTFIGQTGQRGFTLSNQRSKYVAAGITLSLGFAKELYDSGKKNNIFSWKDLTANCVGILTGVILLGIH